jgi:hypothetical protein
VLWWLHSFRLKNDFRRNFDTGEDGEGFHMEIRSIFPKRAEYRADEIADNWFS